MVWDVLKSEKLDLNVFFKLCKGGYFGKSKFILGNREKRLFEHYKKITHN